MSRGIQLIIVWFPRNPKWKQFAPHDTGRILEYMHINEDLPYKEKTCDASKGIQVYATIKTQRSLENRYA